MKSMNLDMEHMNPDKFMQVVDKFLEQEIKKLVERP